MVVASFHLVRLRPSSAVGQLVRIPIDRRRLPHTDGVHFVKLLGTGRGRRMSTSADLRRWALFAVWDDVAAAERFRRDHPLSRRWDRGAVERYDVLLEPLGAHGSWDGADPIAGSEAATPGADERVAVLTRATVRVRKLPTFLASVPAVDRRLHAADGLLATVGIGEIPIGRQATFSLWRDAGAVRDFAYRTPEHARVVERTRGEQWYGEEWFARFRPVEWSGTWDGADPLA